MPNRTIIVGVSGGIAAYKSAIIVSQLVQQADRVRVAMTESAGHFIGPATLTALSGYPVVQRVFDDQHPLGGHIALAEEGDLLCVAPATANFLAKAAHGMADDLLSTLYLSFDGPVVMAPAMSCDMWEKTPVQRNIAQLKTDGVHLVGPDSGWLSCRKLGMGRMSDPAAIVQAINDLLDTPPLIA